MLASGSERVTKLSPDKTTMRDYGSSNSHYHLTGNSHAHHPLPVNVIASHMHALLLKFFLFFSRFAHAL